MGKLMSFKRLLFRGNFNLESILKYPEAESKVFEGTLTYRNERYGGKCYVQIATS